MTTTSRDDLELTADPTRSGVTVVPGSTPLTRVNWFDGALLRASDLALDQGYERTLAALGLRAAGSGVVHGFELLLADGDTLTLRGGLAVTPNGRVLHLPGEARFTLATLLTRSGELAADPAHPDGGSPAFGPCAADTGGATPDVVVDDRPVYVVTLAAEEALCGEAERFGALCADACLTDVDRPRRVEGVRVRARRLALDPLVTSTAVTFTALQERSRVAAAYFAAEARAVPSLISGAGLRSGAWCLGADPAGGDEVPIAVVQVSGGTLRFLDLWTARREFGEPPALRYWDRRLARRPWDVFLAQILQFQCQLVDVAPAPDTPGTGTDPCADERAALRTLSDVVTDLGDRLGLSPDRLAGLGLDAATVGRWRSLTADVADLLATPSTGSLASGSSLVDHGIVETPSAGYLPVDPQADVTAAARTAFGPGVTLRFLTAPSDVVPMLVEQARDRRRIPLTAGLDDPAAAPVVEVIVPDAATTTATATDPAYSGTLSVMSSIRSTVLGASDQRLGSALELRATARERRGAGWQWAVAAFGRAPQSLPVERLVTSFASPLLRRRDDAAETEPLAVPIVADTGEAGDAGDARADRVDLARLVQSANRERQLSRARRARLEATGPEPDRALARDEARPVALWVDVAVAGDLPEAEIGAIVRASARVSSYSRAASNPVLIDVRVEGTLRVTDRRRIGGAGRSVTDLTTVFDGTADPLFVTDSVQDSPPTSFSTQLRWRFATDTAGRPALHAVVDLDGNALPTFRADEPATDQRRAVVGVTNRAADGEIRNGAVDNGAVDNDADRDGTLLGVRTSDAWTSRTDGGLDRELARVELTRADDALAAGSAGRDLAEAAIEAIATELSAPERDPGFAERARALLLDPAAPAPTRLRATRDWVAFRRWGEAVPTTAVAATPPGVRHLRAYHATISDPATLKRFRGLLAQSPAEALDDLGFVLVGVVDFVAGDDSLVTPVAAIRAAWSAADRGSRLLWQAGGDRGEGDGDEVLRRRLAAYRSVVGGLIDVTSTPPAVLLTDVPDEYVGAGTDGAIFTVGLAARRQVAAAQLALVTDRDGLQRLLRTLDAEPGGPAGVDEARLREIVREVDIPEPRWTRIEFLDDEVASPDEVVRWWRDAGRDVPSQVVALMTPGAVEGDEVGRASKVLELLRGGQVEPRPGGPLDDATAVLVFSD